MNLKDRSYKYILKSVNVMYFGLIYFSKENSDAKCSKQEHLFIFEVGKLWVISLQPTELVSSTK